MKRKHGHGHGHGENDESTEYRVHKTEGRIENVVVGSHSFIIIMYMVKTEDGTVISVMVDELMMYISYRVNS